MAKAGAGRMGIATARMSILVNAGPPPVCHRIVKQGGQPVTNRRMDEGRIAGIVSSGDFRGLEHDRLDVETGYWESMR